VLAVPRSIPRSLENMPHNPPKTITLYPSPGD
jgi:hypothetical protein